MSEDFCINLIYGTGGNKWTHHMDDANAGGAKVLEWDLRCFDERTPRQRYQTWIDVTFKDPTGKETKNLQIGPKDPFNLASAGNSTRWSFLGTHVPSPLAGTMELSLRKASVNGTRTPDDQELFKDTKRLGHQVGPTATATGTPVTKKVPLVVDTFNVYIVDQFPAGGGHGHKEWAEDTPTRVMANLKEWFTKVAVLKAHGKLPTSNSDPIYEQPWAEVHWGTSFPTAIKPNEMFVNIVHFDKSKFSAADRQTAVAAQADGMTKLVGSTLKTTKEKDPETDEVIEKSMFVGGKMLCEVWPNRLKLQHFTHTLSQLIFHELMHFKADADSPTAIVHELPGASFGRTPVGDNTAQDPQDRDLQLVADNLDKTFEFFR